MKPIIHIDNTQIRIDNEHYTLSISFKCILPNINHTDPDDLATDNHQKSIKYEKVKTCIFCGKEFKSNHNRRSSCSDECKKQRKKVYMKKWRQSQKHDIDSTLNEIEYRRKQPYKITPPVN